MSEFVRKQPLLEILKQESVSPNRMYDTKQGIKRAIEQIESGAFDAPDGEVQRLRAALERIKKWAEDPELGTMYKIWNLANETLKGDENA